MKARKAAGQENEIKLPLPDVATGRRLLRQAGFRQVRRRLFEANTVFDTPERRLLSSGALLRVREVHGRGVLTFKAPAEPAARHKSRLEIESDVDPHAASLILEQLGYAPVFRYEKFRTEFARPAETGLAMLDEVPIGIYLELEGPPAWVDRTAAALGFQPADYILPSYGRLYLDACARRGVEPANMVFGK